MEGPGETDNWLNQDFLSGKGTMEGPGETDNWLNQDFLSGKGTMEGPGETDNWLNQDFLHVRYLRSDSQLLTYGYNMFLADEREKEDKRLDEEAEKIQAETKELSQKPESDPQVVETAEFFTKMTEEILDQKDRLTKSNLNDKGKRSTPQIRGGGVLERLRRNNSADQSLETIESKHKLRTERATKEIMEDCAQHRKYHDVLKGEYHTGVSLKDEKGMSADQFIQTITTCHPEFANNTASIKDVCCDVKKYIHQISRLVQEKICSLPEEVRKKLESLMMSFQRLISGMWKLLLYDLLLYEMTSLFATYQREESNISRKKGRLKYGFQMASMMALWLAHDVESNPGPSFQIRSCLEKITRQLSEVLRYHLPVEGSLWSESVAEAAFAAGYSTDCQWSNPSGNNKDKLMPLIERATEVGRILTTLGCLPAEFVPFVNDLGNPAVQEQLVIHYKVENLRSAADIVHAIGSLGDEQKQTIMQEILKQIPHSSKIPVDSGRMCTSTDLDRLTDSSTSHPTSCYQKKTLRRKPNRVRHRKENGNHLDNLDKSQNSSLPEPVAVVTLGQQMDPGPDGKNKTSIVLNLDETLSAVSKVQEDMTTKSLSARKRDRSSTSSVGTKRSKPFGSTGDTLANLNEILDSNMTINQSHDIEFDDILTLLDGTETQVQNVMNDAARNMDMPTTATDSPWMAQPQKTRNHETSNDVIGTNPSLLIPVVPFPPEGDQVCQTHDAHTNDHKKTKNYGYPLKCNHQIMELRNLIPSQNASCGENDYWSAEGRVNGIGVEESSMNINAETEPLQQTLSPLATDLNSCHETIREEVTFVNGEKRNEVEDDTCETREYEAETLSSGEEQFASAETETEPIQQPVSPLTAVTNSYPDTHSDEMYREETVDDKLSWTRKNVAKDLTFGTEQFASTEPADTGKQRMEPTIDELFAKLKSSLLEEFDARLVARLEALKTTLGNSTPNEHVVNGNGEPLDCASSDVEHTEPRVRSTDSSRKRNQTDPENGTTSKKRRQ